METSNVFNAQKWQEKKPFDVFVFALITTLIILGNIHFWSWWIQTEEKSYLLFLPFSFALFYDGSFLTFMSLFFGWHIKVPEHTPPPQGKKIALITLTVPGSESINTVETQLKAMSEVSYPHRRFLLVDKTHMHEYVELCEKYGVTYFSRHDVNTWGSEKVAYWNQADPPFKAKTKAGNVNAWIDAYGDEFEFFVQFDIDHQPIPEYLDCTLGFFEEPNVAYVQAPSLYSNSAVSWIARGALEQESMLQGPLQMGFYGATQTPYIIGSHCTYRMSAIKEIGGFQPTRAEDHLDTVYLAAHGYQGVFLPQVIALGDAPDTMETYLGQQFAWAYSMAQVLFSYTPKLLKKMKGGQRFQFLYSQTWYPLWSLSMATLFLTPFLGLLTGDDMVQEISFWNFVQHYYPVFVGNIILYFWSKQFFPMKMSTMTWRQVLLSVARWPIVLMAFIQMLLRIEKPYMITPKGISKGVQRQFHLKTHTSFFGLILLNMMAVIFWGTPQTIEWVIFALWGSLFFVVLYLLVLSLDINLLIQEDTNWKQALNVRKRPLLVGATLILLIMATILNVFPETIRSQSASRSQMGTLTSEE